VILTTVIFTPLKALNNITFHSILLCVLLLDNSVISAQYQNDYQIPDSFNTAKNKSYLTSEEKEIIRYINVVRVNPQQFLQQYLNVNHVDTTNSYVKSLRVELLNLKPLTLLYPNRKLYRIAKSWAIQAGTLNVSGHQGFSKRARKFSKVKPFSECCSYGHNTGLEIVLQLLIDDGVKNLGHRKCLLSNHNIVGVCIKKHKGYRYNAVLDFSNN
jgi:uncharacterized protein YkwD